MLQTAGLKDGILVGTFRQRVLDAVSQSGIDVSVVERCPLLTERSTWSEAFISNR